MARRAIFEVYEDRRFFLQLIDDAVGEGRIELHSFSLMTNHLHLLLVSVDGQLSRTMQDILSQFSRWFNLRRDRDGPLMKSRFFSRPIGDDADRFSVVRCIDQNPVKAGLVDDIFDYPHGSAWHYGRGSCPRWLARYDLEQLVCCVSGSKEFRKEDYARLFGKPAPSGEDWLVEERLRSRSGGAGVGRLLRASTKAWAEWMRRAEEADGPGEGLILASPGAIQDAVTRLRREVGVWAVRPHGRAVSAWEILVVGLLRVGSRRTMAEIARLLSTSRRVVSVRLGHHKQLFATDPLYRDRATGILRNEVRAMLPVAFSPQLRSNFPLGHSVH